MNLITTLRFVSVERLRSVGGILPILCIVVCLAWNSGCTTSDEPQQFSTTPYTLNLKGSLPNVDDILPKDNPLTVEGVELGRRLFYERKFSINNTQSCADCHHQENAFSDPRKVSLGAQGQVGKRNSMSLVNLIYHKEMFWDGRAPTLRKQVLMPIEDHSEMNETLPNVITKLNASTTYPDLFAKAFGTKEINSERIAKALEQFLITLVSVDSRYDRFLRGELTLTPSENRGAKLFFLESAPLQNIYGADCFHCHGTSLFTTNSFSNNGISPDSLFKDLGRFEVTKKNQEQAHFKIPTLRNIALTSPYMHDGRFTTLDEVIEHYNSGVHPSATLDPEMRLIIGGLKLTQTDKADLKAFLHALTDSVFITNQAFAKPKE